MTVPLTELLAVEALALRLIVPPPHPVELSWAHGSDLVDPTPFTEPGQLLLTTGRQFDGDPPEAEYDAYVARLAGAGINALGFGTEVVRHGTPPELARACAAHAVAMFEIPYSTPFIAISRWIADRVAEAAHTRLEWALQTQNAISVAAVGGEGLRAAVSRAGRSLDASVAVLDPDLLVVADHSPDDTSVLLRERVVALLRAGRRAALQADAAGDTVLIRTLGQTRRLRGVLVVRRSTPFDDADLLAITTLTALAEVSLEHGQDIRESVRALLRELFALLQDGQVEIVRTAISALPVGLPRQKMHVLAADRADLPDGLPDTLERHASHPPHRTYHVSDRDRILELVDARHWPAVRDILQAAGARAGVSELLTWAELRTGVLQATRALDAAGRGQLLTFGELVSRSVVGLLAAPAAADIAHGRLGVLADDADGARLLAEASVWLRHNGQWDPAARELGMHRHSLKLRMRRLGTQLGLDLERFSARAELWALLAALGLSDDS